MKKINRLSSLIFLLFICNTTLASSTQKRIDNDIRHHKPIVIQVSVALADNKYQHIVPVPSLIGNGQDAYNNLYWGARYGLKTFMRKDAKWTIISSVKYKEGEILERLILKKKFIRKGRSVTVFLIADAWDGQFIKKTIRQYMNYNAGNDAFTVSADGQTFSAGGDAHLIAYIGHNALMDYAGLNRLFSKASTTHQDKQANDAIVLACKSQPYFANTLTQLGATPLVMTTGLMAPEAYSLNGAIEQWIKGSSDNKVRKAAAKQYNKYQKTGRRGAERLFGVLKD